MAAKYPPEMRAHAVAARRAGARVGDVAATLGVSSALVSYWARTAGVPAETELPPEMVRTCSVCDHPDREGIDMALITSAVVDVMPRFPELAPGPLDRHRRLHLGLVYLGQYAAHRECPVCARPDRDRFDGLLKAGVSRARLEEETGIFRHVLRHHQQHHIDNARRDLTQALAAVRRLTAARSVTDHGGT